MDRSIRIVWQPEQDLETFCVTDFQRAEGGEKDAASCENVSAKKVLKYYFWQ
jgi:hypothetical protein